jgi:protocadherin Fat 1/2/3
MLFLEFAFTYYSATISELAPVSSEVTRVLATSKDIGINAEITYDIVGGNGYNHFGIHPKTGVIFVSSQLDYERIREYVLAIRARDGGSPPLASQALVNISLIDQNDNAPQFSSGSSSYSVQIPEDASIATSVIQVRKKYLWAYSFYPPLERFILLRCNLNFIYDKNPKGFESVLNLFCSFSFP